MQFYISDLLTIILNICIVYQGKSALTRREMTFDASGV